MTQHRFITVDGYQLFYREMGNRSNPTVLLLHGFPSSSHMFRELIPRLAEQYYVIAPDYPGFGNSDLPPAPFVFTFDNLARSISLFLDQLHIDRYSIYMQDFGAPVGFRLAALHPERVQAIISQNGNIYEEGLTPFWETSRALWQRRDAETEAPLRGALNSGTFQWLITHGVRSAESVSPDTWNLATLSLSRPGAADAYFELFYDYRDNVARYGEWQAYLRQYHPPVLAIWGKNDQLFGEAGAAAFRRDVLNARIILLDTGHFALEEDGEAIANEVMSFLADEIEK